MTPSLDKHLRYLPLLTLLCALCLAFAPAASAQSNGRDCSYTQDDGSTPDNSVYSEIEGNTNGLTGQAGPVVGVCVDQPVPGSSGGGQGGSVEAGTKQGDPSKAYVVADGDNDNTDPTGESDGYAGVSTYETGIKGGCAGGGTGSNSGGCVNGAGQTVNAGSPLVCGNEKGNTWANTTQDGCELPAGAPKDCVTGTTYTPVPYKWIPPKWAAQNCPAGQVPTVQCTTGINTPTVPYQWINSSCPVGTIPVYSCPGLSVDGTGVADYPWTSTSCPIDPIDIPLPHEACSAIRVQGISVPYPWFNLNCPVDLGDHTITPRSCTAWIDGRTPVRYQWAWELGPCPVDDVDIPDVYDCSAASVNGTPVPYKWISPFCPMYLGDYTVTPAFCQATIEGTLLQYIWIQETGFCPVPDVDLPPLPPTQQCPGVRFINAVVYYPWPSSGLIGQSCPPGPFGTNPDCNDIRWLRQDPLWCLNIQITASSPRAARSSAG